MVNEATGHPVVVPRWYDYASRQTPPCTQVTKAFRGNNVYKHMKRCLKRELQTKERRGQGLWNFAQQGEGQWICGVVFSDGTPQTQRAPITQSGWGMWWPVIALPQHETRIQVWDAFCQQQALTESRPWPTDVSRIVRLREATAEDMHCTPRPVIPPPYPVYPTQAPLIVIDTPGPVIEEVEPEPAYDDFVFMS